MSAASSRPRYAPIPIPATETLLWRGAPTARLVARHVLNGVWVAAWLGLFLTWWVAASAHADLASLITGLKLAGLAAGVLSLLAGYAVAVARSTTYTVTSERVMMRFGVALPMTVDIPLALIEGVDLKLHADGTGDVALRVSNRVSIAWPVFWPHVRPWHLRRPQPALRALPEAQALAQRLARALAAQAEQRAEAMALAAAERRAPALAAA